MNSNSEKSRILVVDDEKMVRDVIAAILEKFNFDSEICATDADALEIIRDAERKFVAAIIDVNLKNTSGVDLARKIITERAGIKIILTSGYPRENSNWNGFEPDYFLEKPINFAELKTAVDKIFEKREC